MSSASALHETVEKLRAENARLGRELARLEALARARELLLCGGADSGAESLRSIARVVAELSGVRCVVLGEIVAEEPARVHSLAAWIDGGVGPTLDYPLAGAPCERVAAGEPVCVPRGLAERFPDCELARWLGAQSYVAVPLRAPDGAALGILAGWHDRALERPDVAQAMLPVFADRAGLELARRRAAAELARNERRYRAIFDHAAIGIARLSLEGVILEANAALCNVLGYELRELVGNTAQNLTHPDDLALTRELWRQLLSGEISSYRAEKRYLRKDGTLVWGAISGAIVHASAGEPGYVIGVLEDITARKELEARVAQSQKLESLGRLAGGIAHDFNNLLTVLLSYTELASSAADPGELAGYLANIRTAGERAAALTAQLLDFARRRPATLRVVDVNESLAEAERLLARLIGEHIRLATRPCDPPARVRADPDRLQQILLNLSVNARDAMPEGGELSIEACAVDLAPGAHPGLAAGPYVCIAVADTGVGMGPEVVAHAFEPFFTTKVLGGGIGMGLATSYGIVKACRGDIAIESEPDRGTTVRVWLPRVSEEDPEDEEPAPEEP